MKKILQAGLGLVLLWGAWSCEKKETTYRLTVEVTVRDSILVQNALVRVWAPLENSRVDEYRFTNEQGVVNMEFDSKMVLDIRAGKGSYKRCTFVELQRGDNFKRLDIIPITNDNTGCDENP